MKLRELVNEQSWSMFLLRKEAPNNRRARQAPKQVLATDCKPNPKESLSRHRQSGKSKHRCICPLAWENRGHDSTLKFIMATGSICWEQPRFLLFTACGHNATALSPASTVLSQDNRGLGELDPLFKSDFLVMLRTSHRLGKTC